MTMFRDSASKLQRIDSMDAANVYNGEPEAEEVATLNECRDQYDASVETSTNVEVCIGRLA